VLSARTEIGKAGAWYGGRRSSGRRLNPARITARERGSYRRSKRAAVRRDRLSQPARNLMHSSNKHGLLFQPFVSIALAGWTATSPVSARLPKELTMRTGAGGGMRRGPAIALVAAAVVVTGGLVAAVALMHGEADERF
jgi:hypothetical protein